MNNPLPSWLTGAVPSQPSQPSPQPSVPPAPTSLSPTTSVRKLDKRNLTGYRGVSMTPNSNKFRAQTYFGGKARFVGDFDSVDEAFAELNKFRVRHGVPPIA